MLGGSTNTNVGSVAAGGTSVMVTYQLRAPSTEIGAHTLVVKHSLNSCNVPYGEVSWNMSDFVVMGLLLLGTGSVFVLVSRRSPRRRRVVIGVAFAAALLFIWAELAVGVFTNLGT